MKSTPSFRLLTLVGAVAFVLSAPFGKAILLDWDTLTWTPGALVQSYELDPGNVGNDVTITVSGTTGALIASSPFISTAPFTGGNAGQSALQFLQNFANAGQSITVTVDFHYGIGVTDVAYNLFDVDLSVGSLGTSIDQVRGSSASLIGGGTVTPTTFTGSLNNAVTAGPTVTGIANSGNSTSDANVAVNYGGSVALSQFVFTYGNDASASGILPPEGIALGDISFTPVPEAGTVAACAVVSLLGAWGLRRMRRGQPQSVES